ncbi:related to Pre-rRNA-processing protein RIX1 [Saccharomycodes ludwigii]|uniref:Pre-rRNA-processing protein RIX1 n=1 Tax=Saccharomycodes ludwigii TaxID=36035 RepID=A0A376B649_9ASCO|nr:related to Pre-rRNA-processing protein RIX1 [Saccharomycodes ludwigii]
MSDTLIPLSLIIPQLESASGAEFEAILKILRSKKYVNQSLLKSDLSLLSAKILKLLNAVSSNNDNADFSVWKGCHLAMVLCTYNPVFLCAYSNSILTALCHRFQLLSDDYTGQVVNKPCGRAILKTVVFSITIITDLLRGKPALTRECLTPKLPLIISNLVYLSKYEPEICLPVIHKLLQKNTVTFKPFANKFFQVLNSLIVNNFFYFNLETQQLITDSFAVLHLIKFDIKELNSEKDVTKQHQKKLLDIQWRKEVNWILAQFKPIVELIKVSLLDFSADDQISHLYESLPRAEKSVSDHDEKFVLKFPALDLDLNEPVSLFQIEKRLDILCKLLISLIRLPTPFPIRVPLPVIINVSEVLLNLTTNFLPLQKGLRRDEEVTSVITNVLPKIQFKGVVLLKACLDTFGGCMVPYTTNILNSLEQYIPLLSSVKASKHTDQHVNNAKINYFKCTDILSYEFGIVFKITSELLKEYIGKNTIENESTLFAKLVDVALHLTQSESLIGSTAQVNNNTINPSLSSKKNNKRISKQQNAIMGSMSDLYSHPGEFYKYSSLSLYDEINNFLGNMVKYVVLSSTQQIKITKYAIVNCVKFKDVESFKKLVKYLVLYPGTEKVSILPIACSLLKDDEMIEILRNPKLPINFIQNAKKIGEEKFSKEEESEDEDEEGEAGEAEDVIGGKEAINSIVNGNSTETNFVTTLKLSEEENTSEPIQLKGNEDKIFKRKQDDITIEKEDEEQDETKRIKISVTKTDIPPSEIYVKNDKDVIKNSENEDKDSDGSDFEIPELDVSED